MSSMRPRRVSWSVDSPHSGRARADTSSYWATRSRHWGCKETRSDTIRFTSGRVRLASARVKYLRGTGQIYAEMPVLFPDDHYALNEFRMRNKPHHPLISVHYHDRRADVRVFLVQPLDPVSLELRIECYDNRILARVRLHLARLGIVARRHALHDDVAVGDRAQVAPVLGIIHHRHDRYILGPHQQRHLRASGTGGGDERLGDHDFAGEHGRVM